MVIHIPFKYHKREGEDHEVARWGGANVPWSGTLAEFVYYYDKPLCTAIPWSNGTGFPFYPNKKEGSDNNGKSIRPFILMAPPGPCSPVNWARHAQFAGAAALMVVDNVCQCNDDECVQKYTATDCRFAGQPVLVNDGTAGDVTIPVWLVPKLVGQNLIASVTKDNQPVLVEYAWGLPVTNETEKAAAEKKQNKTVTYHLWTAAAHDPQLTEDNVQELRTVVRALPDHLLLVPKFRLLDGTHFNCPQFTDASTSPCDHLCTNGGRYCAIHQVDLSGQPIVKETLRRLCIWKHYAPTNYWDYWVHHATVCKKPHLYADEDCINQGLHEANMDPSIINDCMKGSGDVEENTSNALLETMIEEQEVSGVVKLPAIAHGDTLEQLDHGASAHSLFESVCLHFYWRAKSTNLHWEDIPKVCETCGECPNLIGCLEAGKCVGFDHHDGGSNDNHNKGGGKDKPSKGKGNSSHRGRRRFWRFFWFLVIVGLCGYGYYYYQQQQRDMYGGGTGGGLLGSYLQLSGNEN